MMDQVINSTFDDFAFSGRANQRNVISYGAVRVNNQNEITKIEMNNLTKNKFKQFDQRINAAIKKVGFRFNQIIFIVNEYHN